MRMDYYSNVTKGHHISKEEMRQSELDYIASIEREKLKELQKLNAQSVNTEVAYTPITDNFILQKVSIKSPQDLKQLLLQGLKEHKQDLQDRQNLLNFIKQNDKLVKSLNNLKKKGFFQYLLKRGSIQREITLNRMKYPQYRYLLNDPELYKECRQDLPKEIKEIKKDIEINLSLMKQLKESI